MKKVAIFGNAGAGKSTLSRTLAESTGLPLHTLDKVIFLPGGEEIPHDQYIEKHSALIDSDQWIIDGYGCFKSTWQRLKSADTLVYIDLPIYQHYWWVTKRFLKGIFKSPEGWPENSPLLKSTVNSFRVVKQCHQLLTPRYREYVAKVEAPQKLHHLRSKKEIAEFLDSIDSID
ncbi:MAG: adenylate kinase [Kangiellaceae bacterium]|nr:adenylate kinase [Kangiellaceae bacterium]